MSDRCLVVVKNQIDLGAEMKPWPQEYIKLRRKQLRKNSQSKLKPRNEKII